MSARLCCVVQRKRERQKELKEMLRAQEQDQSYRGKR
jgi:hypothetical protein